MNEPLKRTPVLERPAVPLFPAGAGYFRRWRTLRWFLAGCVPVVASAAALESRGHGMVTALFLVLYGAGVAAWLFHGLCSGLISSNWGTHFRASEPRGYWTQFAVGALVYLAVAVAGYFV